MREASSAIVSAAPGWWVRGVCANRLVGCTVAGRGAADRRGAGRPLLQAVDECSRPRPAPANNRLPKEESPRRCLHKGRRQLCMAAAAISSRTARPAGRARCPPPDAAAATSTTALLQTTAGSAFEPPDAHHVSVNNLPHSSRSVPSSQSAGQRQISQSNRGRQPMRTVRRFIALRISSLRRRSSNFSSALGPWRRAFSC